MTWGTWITALLSSHAKETKYSLRVPSRTTRVYMDILEVWLWPHFFLFGVRHRKANAITQASGLVSSNWYYPRFSIARSCEDLVKAEEQLMGVDKGNPEQRRSYL